MKRPVFDLALYFVVGPADCDGRAIEDVVGAALEGGVTLVQLRDKKADDAALVDLGRKIQPLCRAAGVPLIINDRLEPALLLEAEGIHVGQEDLAVAQIRPRLGYDRIVGVSAGSLEELSRVAQDQVDYLGVGPVNSTLSKSDAGAAIGSQGVAIIRENSSLPIVAIGGIKLPDVAPLISAGAQGVAVVSAIAAAPDPKEAAQRLRNAVEEARSGLKGQA